MINFSKVKPISFFLFSALLIANKPSLVFAQSMGNNFELKGKISGHDTGMIYLGYYIDKEQKVINDSSLIVDGNFYFKGNISEPTVAFIDLYNTKVLGINTTEIFLEPSILNLAIRFNRFREARMTGSVTQNQYQDLQASKITMREKFRTELDQLDLLVNSQKEGNRDSLFELLEPLFDFEKKQ